MSGIKFKLKKMVAAVSEVKKSITPYEDWQLKNKGDVIPEGDVDDSEETIVEPEHIGSDHTGKPQNYNSRSLTDVINHFKN